MFRLIALRPLRGCSDYALKCLHIDETYYFCKYFTIAGDGRVSWSEGYHFVPYCDLYKVDRYLFIIVWSLFQGKKNEWMFSKDIFQKIRELFEPVKKELNV